MVFNTRSVCRAGADNHTRSFELRYTYVSERTKLSFFPIPLNTRRKAVGLF